MEYALTALVCAALTLGENARGTAVLGMTSDNGLESTEFLGNRRKALRDVLNAAGQREYALAQGRWYVAKLFD